MFNTYIIGDRLLYLFQKNNEFIFYSFIHVYGYFVSDTYFHNIKNHTKHCFKTA